MGYAVIYMEQLSRIFELMEDSIQIVPSIASFRGDRMTGIAGGAWRVAPAPGTFPCWKVPLDGLSVISNYKYDEKYGTLTKKLQVTI